LISHLTTREVLIRFKTDKVIKNERYFEKNSAGYEVFLLPYSLTVGQLLKELNLDMNEIQDLKVKEGSLEDVFNSVTEGQNV
ncbi:MAG: hypothetical protein OXJ52_07020, partial [Oligoflexia bacterium]|nr:hypothetical protein [Oligoflexia bacterium]